MKIRESLSAARQALLVDARTDDLETLIVRVTNMARRPLTLVSVDVAYGPLSQHRTQYWIAADLYVGLPQMESQPPPMPFVK